MRIFNQPQFIKIICLAVFLVPNISQAGVEQQMQNFLGENTNYTEGGMYKSQSRGYYATPSIYSRNPIMDVKPLSFSMPSARSGCGGIDLFAGSFSHINADQFVALLRTIPQNALGYAFQLAMDTISPMIADNINKMEDIMRDITSDTLNSCDLGKSIVNAPLSQFQKGEEIICVRQQMDQGRAQDLAEARRNCTSNGKKTSTNSNSNEEQDAAIADINYAWNEISKLTDDNNLREFIQTITGTIIVKRGANDDTPYTTKTYPSLVTSPATFDALLKGGSMKIYKCDEDTKCLNINDTATQTINSDVAFLEKIKEVLESVSEKMKARDQELTEEEAELLSVTDVPIVAILRTYQRYYAQEMNSMVSDSLSEIVAHDLLNNFMSDLLNKVENISQQNNSKEDVSKLRQFQKSVKDARTFLSQKQFELQQKRKTLLDEVNRAKVIEHEAADVLIGKMYKSQ